MIRRAVASGEYQFRAGPQTHRFYACRKHYHELRSGKSPDPDLFWRVPGDADFMEREDDEIACDWCRGEDGP